MKKITLMLVILFTLFSCKSKQEKQVKELEKEGKVFGIDMSHYQEDVNWDKVAAQKKLPIKFFIFRATMGAARKDTTFQKNYREAKKRKFIVGAYHLYDPREDPKDQAKNYLNSVSSKLKHGDIIPILDVEGTCDSIPIEKLAKNIKIWLDIVEKKYKVKPMIYTSLRLCKCNLPKFSSYPKWIAAYSIDKRDDSLVQQAAIHQFSDRIKVKGIKGRVDGNDIDPKVLDSLLLKPPKKVKPDSKDQAYFIVFLEKFL